MIVQRRSFSEERGLPGRGASGVGFAQKLETLNVFYFLSSAMPSWSLSVIPESGLLNTACQAILRKVRSSSGLGKLLRLLGAASSSMSSGERP